MKSIQPQRLAVYAPDMPTSFCRKIMHAHTGFSTLKPRGFPTRDNIMYGSDLSVFFSSLHAICCCLLQLCFHLGHVILACSEQGNSKKDKRSGHVQARETHCTTEPKTACISARTDLKGMQVPAALKRCSHPVSCCSTCLVVSYLH